MTTRAGTKHEPIRELSADEGRALLDRAARRYLDMSGESFIRAWEAGEIDADDPRTHSAVMRVAMLVPCRR